MASNFEDILEVIQALPDISSKQLAEHVSHISRSGLNYHLIRMVEQGRVTRKCTALPGGGPGAQYLYRINPTPTPPSKPKLKLVKPTEAGLQARLDEAKATITELEAWKAEAITRFPDLGVDPEILQARRIVSDIMSRRGDKAAALDVLAGRRDGNAIMEATIAALSQGAAA